MAEFPQFVDLGSDVNQVKLSRLIPLVQRNLAEVMAQSRYRIVYGRLPEIYANQTFMEQLFRHILFAAISIKGQPVRQVNIDYRLTTQLEIVFKFSGPICMDFYKTICLKSAQQCGACLSVEEGENHTIVNLLLPAQARVIKNYALFAFPQSNN